MDESRVREIVERDLSAMKWLTGTSYFTTDVAFRELVNDDTGSQGMGEIRMDESCHMAWIVINPAAHDKVIEVQRTLRHELLHLAHVGFDHLHASVKEVLGSDRAAIPLSRDHFRAGEHLVQRIEGIMDDILPFPAQIKLARRKCK